ncbi:uncharacterized protein LOC120331936 isoform X1 [Styela clava]
MGSGPSKRKEQSFGRQNEKVDFIKKQGEQDDEDQVSISSDDFDKGNKKNIVGKNTDFEKIQTIIEGIMEVLGSSEDFSETGILTNLRQAVKIYFALKRTRRDDLNAICNIMLRKGILDVFIRMWDHFHLNPEDFYSNATTLNFRIMKQMKLLLWNYSDKCADLPKAISKKGEVVRRLMKELTMPELGVENLKRQQLRYMIKGTLSILMNCVRHCNKIKIHIRKNNGIDTLLAYEKSTYLIIKAEVYILLAYCITEEENTRIVTGSGVIGFIVNVLSSAVASPNHVAKKYLFSAQETVIALNKLAQNDENKKTIVEAGVLPILTRLLSDEKKTTPEEQYETINCIWTLAFHTENKDRIINEPCLIDITKRLKLRSGMDARAKLHKACCSLLFILDLEERLYEEELKPHTKTKHVMLSYNWEVQETMIKLREYLRQKGYEVWMDVEKMQDSILSAMAEAIENAAIVLVAMTETYKNSNPCRTEAEYAYRREVAVLPLLLQSEYVADGWLGAMVGTKLYVDLSGGFHEKKFAEVAQQISGIVSSSKILEHNPVLAKPVNASTLSTQSNDGGGNGPQESLLGFSILQYNIPCSNWSKQKVLEWCKCMGLKDQDSFPKLDGASLSQLCKMLIRSPDNYYSVLRNDFHFSAEDVLIMTDAVEELLANKLLERD